MARVSESTFLSSDGKTNLYYREYLPEGEAVGIVQIAYGTYISFTTQKLFSQVLYYYSTLSSHLRGFIGTVCIHEQLDAYYRGYREEQDYYDQFHQEQACLGVGVQCFLL